MTESEELATAEIPPGARSRRPGRRIAVGLGAVLVVAVVASAVYVVGGYGNPSRGLLNFTPAYGCDAGPHFGVDGMSGPANAENGTDGAAAALRRAIDGPPSEDAVYAGALPAAGWLRVSDGSDVVQFLAPATNWGFGYASVLATRSAADWTTSVGHCFVAPKVDGYTSNSWDLAASPSPQSTTIHVFWENALRPCVTLVGWTIQYYPDKVIIAFWDRWKFSDPHAGCAFRGWYVLTDIQLKEPLGNRTLYDGSSLPLKTPKVLSGKTPDETWRP